MPNDATGDFDFTRQSIGTRVRKDGLIEEAKTVGSITNEFLYSEDFTQSNWFKSSATITANATISPIGTNNADLMTATASNGGIFEFDEWSTTLKTASIYVKKNTATSIQILNGSTGANVTYDLNNGVVSSVSSSFVGRIETLSNDWYRLSATHSIASGTQTVGIRIPTSGQSAYIWGAMLSEGALSDYIKTEGSQETKTVETFTDVPRLDWLNSNCPSLLLEGQRTNAFTYSQDFSNSNWAKTEFTISSNEITAPDGTLTASELFETSASSGKFLHQNTSVTTGNDYTISYFVKYQNKQFIQLTGSTGFDLPYVNFDILNGEIVRNLDNADARIENFGNGWYRISLTLEATSTTSGRILLVGIRAATSFRAESYTGDTSNSYYIWGGQMEQGSYPTSYIKTEVSTVTRLVDSCEVASGLENVINQTEGVFYIEFEYLYETTTDSSTDANRDILVLGTASDISEGISIDNYRSQFRVFIQGSGMTTQSVGNNTSGSSQPNTRYKLAVNYKSGDNKAYLNGSLLGSVQTGNVNFATDLDGIFFSYNSGSRPYKNQKKVYDLRVYDTALTDAELIELTTL